MKILSSTTHLFRTQCLWLTSSLYLKFPSISPLEMQNRSCNILESSRCRDITSLGGILDSGLEINLWSSRNASDFLTAGGFFPLQSTHSQSPSMLFISHLKWTSNRFAES